MKHRIFAALAVLGIVIGSAAHASVVYDSIAGTNIAGADGAYDGNSIMANSFYFPGSSAGPIASITLGLGTFGSSGNSLMVYLAPDVGPSGIDGVPVSPDLSQAVQIGSVSDTLLSPVLGVPSLVSFSVPASVSDALAAETFNNEYWVVAVDDVTGAVASDAIWYFNDGNPVGFGADGQAHGNALGGLVPNGLGNGPYLMVVEQVPEPVSIALVGVGLAGLGYVRRRRDQKV